jgi:hypothetical protein
LGPDTDLGRANSARVVGQALLWAGLIDDEVRAAWEAIEYHPAITGCYGALIGMIRQPPGEALFQGGGDLGTPESPQAFPHFTSCRLTRRGERLARQLLAQYPEYRTPGESTASADPVAESGSRRSEGAPAERHCCEDMRREVERVCPEHPDRFECPDCLVHYHPRFREYGLIVHDGGSSWVCIQFCPWCGVRLPESLRGR